MFDLALQKLVYDIKLILLKWYKKMHNNNWIQKERETYIYVQHVTLNDMWQPVILCMSAHQKHDPIDHNRLCL